MCPLNISYFEMPNGLKSVSNIEECSFMDTIFDSNGFYIKGSSPMGLVIDILRV